MYQSHMQIIKTSVCSPERSGQKSLHMILAQTFNTNIVSNSLSSYSTLLSSSRSSPYYSGCRRCPVDSWCVGKKCDNVWCDGEDDDMIGPDTRDDQCEECWDDLITKYQDKKSPTTVTYGHVNIIKHSICRLESQTLDLHSKVTWYEFNLRLFLFIVSTLNFSPYLWGFKIFVSVVKILFTVIFFWQTVILWRNDDF